MLSDEMRPRTVGRGRKGGYWKQLSAVSLDPIVLKISQYRRISNEVI